MCAAAKRLPHLHLSFQDEFHYLNQGDSPLIDGVDDLASYDDTISAMSVLGFTPKQQDDLLRILAAILHLGNVNITSHDGHRSDSEGSFISVCIFLAQFCYSTDVQFLSTPCFEK